MKEIIKTDLILDFIKSKGWSKTKFCKTWKVTVLTFEKNSKQKLSFWHKSVVQNCKCYGH